MTIIIPFPAKHIAHTNLAGSQDNATGSACTVEERSDRSARASAIATAITTSTVDADNDPVLDVARIVGLVLRTCRRLGRKPARLSPIIAGDLERHCRLGDATAMLLRDWLSDKSSFQVGIPRAIAASEAAAPVAGEG